MTTSLSTPSTLQSCIETLSSSFNCSAHHPVLHSFPTRRSSDLEIVRLVPEDIDREAAGIDLHPDVDDLPQELVDRRHRSEEHTSELQSHSDLVCRLLLEKKKTRRN